MMYTTDVKITFLGTGSSTPTPKIPGKPFRSYAGTLIETQENVLLFDIGPGTVHKLLGLGIDILTRPSHVFLSHYHLDHCLDIISLMKARGLHYKHTGERNVLNIYGPAGLETFLHQLFSGIEKWNYMEDELKVCDVMTLKETLDGEVVTTSDFKVSCCPIKHYDGVCYKLESESKSIIYSGDMGYDENLAVLGKDADLAIVECSYPDRDSLKGLHLCPTDIGKLATLGNFNKTALTHMYPSCEGLEEEMKNTIENLSSTRVIITEDLFSLSL